MNNFHVPSLMLLAVLGLPMTAAHAVKLDSTVAYETYEIGFFGVLDVENPLQKPAVYDGRIGAVDGVSITGDFSALPDGALYVHVIDSAQAVGKVEKIASWSASEVQLESAIDGLTEGDRIIIRPYLQLADISATPQFANLAGVRVNMTKILDQKTYSWKDGKWTDIQGNDASNVLIPPGVGFSIINGRGDLSDRSITLTGEWVNTPWN